MNRLQSELERLYFLPAQRDGVRPDAAASLPLCDGEGRVRTLAVDFGRARDWPSVEVLYRALQSDLDLPAPAIAVRANVGYALWLSLADPVALVDAQAFLDALRRSYLADLPHDVLTLRPAATAPHNLLLPLLPALDAANGNWSAFIDPTLGAMFIDEPWLEMAPNMDRQADLLAALKSIARDDFARARARLEDALSGSASPAAAKAAVDSAGAAATDNDHSHSGKQGRSRSTLALGGGFADPASFLLALMNDPSASARQRIAAAKALLPYYGKKAG